MHTHTHTVQQTRTKEELFTLAEVIGYGLLRGPVSAVRRRPGAMLRYFVVMKSFTVLVHHVWHSRAAIRHLSVVGSKENRQ